MAKITIQQLNDEIHRAGEIAKLTPGQIAHIQKSVAGKRRVSQYTLRTRNSVNHPLLLAGILDADGNTTGSNVLKSEQKIDKFLHSFAPTGVPQKRDSFVDVI